MRKILLPTIFLVLGYGFWVMPELKAICAGVAIFLFGMLSLEEGFKAFTGGILEKLLARTTDRLWKSLSFGVITTSLMQSSSLVSVITISFLSAGLIQLTQGIGIIFGANLGTTTGAWLVAAFGLKVNIAAYAMPMLVFGVILVFQKSRLLKGIGYVLAGMGFLFLGIHYMKEGFEAFKAQLDLSQFHVEGVRGLLLFTLLGIVATVVMQSSHATLVLIITALAAGQISYHSALALAIGANVGTTITAVIGSLSANIAGKRLAAAHLLFNLVTAAVAMVCIVPLGWLVDWSAVHLGIGAEDYTLKLSLFHTFFNALGIVLMLPLMGLLVRGLERYLISGERRSKMSLPANQEDRRGDIDQALYLNESVLEYPDTALNALIMEVDHLYDNAYGVIAHGLFLHRHQLESVLPVARAVASTGVSEPFTQMDTLYQRYIRQIYAELMTFASRAQAKMNRDQSAEVFALKSASRDLVNAVKDVKHLQKNLVRYMESDHAVMKAEYQGMRERLGYLLRELHRLYSQRERLSDAELVFSRLRLEVEKADILANGTLDSLIREGLITQEMTSSLVNDSHYCGSIARQMISSLEVILTASSGGHGVLTRTLSLEQEEAVDLVEEQDVLEEERG